MDYKFAMFQNDFRIKKSPLMATKRSSSHPTIMSATGRKADMKSHDIMIALEQRAYIPRPRPKNSANFFSDWELNFFSGLNVGGPMVPKGPPAFDKFGPAAPSQIWDPSGEKRPRNASVCLPIAYPTRTRGHGNNRNPLKIWCRRRDSNSRPTHYECVALPAELLRLDTNLL